MHINPLLPTFCLFKIALIIFCPNVNSTDAEIVVTTSYGKLRGRIHRIGENAGEMDVFFGIPFAKAKRFEVKKF